MLENNDFVEVVCTIDHYATANCGSECDADCDCDGD
jgi:hypothetical protein